MVGMGMAGLLVLVDFAGTQRKQYDMAEHTRGIIWTIQFGLVVGILAKLLHPGKENMGFIMTAVLGIAGSLSAGVIGQFLGWYKAGEGAGFIASVVVSVLLLLLLLLVVVVVVYGKIRGASGSGTETART